MSFKILKVFGPWGTAIGIAGAVGAFVLGKSSIKLRPALVKVVEYGYAFKENIFGGFDTVIEDMEDIVAEAKHRYEDEKKRNISIETDEE